MHSGSDIFLKIYRFELQVRFLVLPFIHVALLQALVLPFIHVALLQALVLPFIPVGLLLALDAMDYHYRSPKSLPTTVLYSCCLIHVVLAAAVYHASSQEMLRLITS